MIYVKQHAIDGYKNRFNCNISDIAAKNEILLDILSVGKEDYIYHEKKQGIIAIALMKKNKVYICIQTGKDLIVITIEYYNYSKKRIGGKDK